jgi:two-component system chemotaxis response regulator CheY
MARSIARLEVVMDRNHSVLVVDELVFVRRTFMGVLRQHGFKCYEASSLAQAMDSYHLFRPGIVVLGKTQGAASVAEGVEAFRRYDPCARVVVCIEEATRSLVLETVRAGAADFVLRPFKPERLILAVRGEEPEIAPVAPAESREDWLDLVAF